MKLSEQVCTAEQGRKLFSLGITGESIFQSGDNDVPQMGPSKVRRWNVAELGAAYLLALNKEDYEPSEEVFAKYGGRDKAVEEMYNPSLIADLLIEALESGKVTADEVNTRLNS